MPDDELPSAPPPTPPSAWVPPPPEQPEATPAAPPTGADLALALVGGLVGAIVGGIVWGYLLKTTKTELGIVAIGVGVLAGFGVALLARGKHGRPFQVIAALAALVGILWGKYFGFVILGREVLESEFGIPGDTLPLFSGDTFSLFTERLLGAVQRLRRRVDRVRRLHGVADPGRSRLRPHGAGNPAGVTALPEVPRPI